MTKPLLLNKVHCLWIYGTICPIFLKAFFNCSKKIARVYFPKRGRNYKIQDAAFCKLNILEQINVSFVTKKVLFSLVYQYFCSLLQNKPRKSKCK